MKKIILLTIALASLAGHAAAASPKLFIFDCGKLTFEDVTSFDLSNDETPTRTLFVPCYLIEHEQGRLLWDGGLPLDVAGQGPVTPEAGMTMTYGTSLVDQLAQMGIVPGDIAMTAYSHFHFDHIGAAPAFTESTLLIQEAEYRAAILEPEKYAVFQPEFYEGIEDAPRRILNGDHDVFGDGTVEIISAPGHTPGHQVLKLTLENTGTIVLSGDLYHFRESRQWQRVPEFNTSREDTLASMKKVEEIIEETGATLWIEHDYERATASRLAPAYYD